VYDGLRQPVRRELANAQSEPTLSGFYDGVLFGIGTGRGSEGRPGECRRADVAEAFGRVTPAAVEVGMGGEPLQTVLNEKGGMRRAANGVLFNDAQGADGCGGGECAAGKLTDPPTGTVAGSEQLLSRSSEGTLEATEKISG
jgi:hypothetical protein